MVSLKATHATNNQPLYIHTVLYIHTAVDKLRRTMVHYSAARHLTHTINTLTPNPLILQREHHYDMVLPVVSA